MSKARLVTIALMTVMTLGTVTPVTNVNAATIKVASKASQKNKQRALYAAAKKMMKHNRNGVSGKAKIFSKKAYPATGAASGYSDFLLGLKKQGYKFTAVQKKMVKKNLIVSSKSDPAVLANAIIGLQAMGINPKAYQSVGTKHKVNLVTTLYKKSLTKQTVNIQSQALIAVSSNKTFKRPSKAKFSKTSLSNRIAKDQQSNHGWAYNNTVAGVDSDTTAVAVNALTMGRSQRKLVTVATKNGRAYLKKAVYKSGAFGYSYNGKNFANANSTAEAIVGLATNKAAFSLINHTAIKRGQQATPLRAMNAYVTAKGTVKGAMDSVLAYGQVSLANSAYHNGKYTNKLIYTFK
ncbi:fucose-binding lectin II [Levilactobacillus yonginensis]|uniref:fucose-binding lectin II n=1 Tax=Levilactobacillus yonginensis TaxID=1054041 RepID=UPI00345D7D57